MSIEFYPDTEWEIIEHPCDVCKGATCTPGNPDPAYADPWCTGGIGRPNVPTVQFANGNAVALLQLLGLPSEPSGLVTPEDLPEIQRALTAARNSRSRRAIHDADSYDVGGPGTGHARVVYTGNTDAQTLRRLDAFQEFLIYCRYNNLGFYWA